LGAVAESEEMRERLRRATGYPYGAPERSFLQHDGRALELPAEFDLGAREPLLAYGSNAAPEALARKLAPDAATPLPLIRAELAGFDVVYSAHLSPYGAVPATLYPCPAATVPVFVAYPTEVQRRLLAATEPNYERARLEGIRCLPERGEPLGELEAFLSRHGCLPVDGAPVALAAIPTRGRTLAAMTEPEALEHVRATHFPELSLSQLVEAATAAGSQPLNFR
jgi:hypothetical protein